MDDPSWLRGFPQTEEDRVPDERAGRRAAAPGPRLHVEPVREVLHTGGGRAVTLWRSAAFGAFFVSAAPAAPNGAGRAAAQMKLFDAALPLLEPGALEVRLVARQDRVESYLVLKVTADDHDSAARRTERACSALLHLADQLLPGLRLQRLGGHETHVLLGPMKTPFGGDFRPRRTLIVPDLDAPFSVAAAHAAGLVEEELLVRVLTDQPEGTVLSIAAQSFPLPQEELRAHEDRLEALEAQLRRRDAPDAAGETDLRSETSRVHLELGAATLRERLSSPHATCLARLSLAAPTPLSEEAVEALRECFEVTYGGLSFRPALEHDAKTFSANLGGLDFAPWGDTPGAASRFDVFGASRKETLELLRLPLRAGRLLALHHLDPAPRAVPPETPAQGAVLGTNHFRARPRPVALGDDDRTRHTYILGQTGTGKSTCMATIIAHDIARGGPVCVVDAHGALIDEVLDGIPAWRADDVLLLDPTDEGLALSLNPFDARGSTQQDAAVQQVITMLYRIYDPRHSGIMGPRFEHWFRSSALTTMADPKGGTLLDIPRLFMDDQFLAGKLRFVEDPVIREFWVQEMGRTSDFHKSEMLGWFVAKLSAFRSDRTMRRVLGTATSALDFDRLMAGRDILLVSLPKGRLGEINMMLLGMIVLSKIQLAAMRRPVGSPLFSLHVDEFQNFHTVAFEALLAEARKYGLAITLANQFLAQLDEPVIKALLGNVANLIVFRPGLPDAQLLQHEFAGTFAADDLIRLENYRAACRIAASGAVAAPFDFTAAPPPPFTGSGPLLRECLRNKQTHDWAAASSSEPAPAHDSAPADDAELPVVPEWVNGTARTTQTPA